MHRDNDPGAHGVNQSFGLGGADGVIAAHGDEQRVHTPEGLQRGAVGYMAQVAQMGHPHALGTEDVDFVPTPEGTLLIVVEGVYNVHGGCQGPAGKGHALGAAVIPVVVGAEDALRGDADDAVARDVVIGVGVKDHASFGSLYKKAAMAEPGYLHNSLTSKIVYYISEICGMINCKIVSCTRKERMGRPMSLRCVLGRLYTRETRRFSLPGKQAVSEGSSVYSAAQILRDRRRRKPLVVLAAEPEGETLFRALRENDLAWSVFLLPSLRPAAEYAEAAGQRYKTDGCDCIVALGGSPVMTAAKAAAAWVARPGVLRGGRPYARLRVPRVPMVFAIPTQLCSGEALGETVVEDENGVCRTLAGRALVPAVVLLDPAFLENASRQELAAAGFEGLCMAVEAYITPGKGDPEAITLAARAVRGFLENLEPCWNAGGMPTQRSALMEASRKAELAASALGYGHGRSLCRGLCAAGVDGGTAYAVLLPLILEKYGNTATERLARLAVLAGVMDTGSQAERASALIARIRDAGFRMGLPETIPDVSGPELDSIAYQAASDVHSLPPVYWSEEKCRKILALAGKIDE